MTAQEKAVQDQKWHLTATGLLTSALAQYVSTSDRDIRTAMAGAGVGTKNREGTPMHNYCLVLFAPLIGYVPSSTIIQELLSYIKTPVWAPELELPIGYVTGIDETGGTISTDDAPEGYQVMLHSWDFVKFTEVGLLSEHSSPGAGSYVVVLQDTETEANGYPDQFITIS